MTELPDTTADWYDVVDDGSLRQGDIFRDLLVPYADLNSDLTEGSPVSFNYELANFLIASASCDVDRTGKYPHILLQKIVPVSDLRKSGKELDDLLEVLRKGLVPTQHLLAGSELLSPHFPLSIALHKQHALVTADYLRIAAQRPRLRLKSPHRERFGNWVAGCFGRVGIEDHDQMPAFGKAHPSHVLGANAGE